MIEQRRRHVVQYEVLEPPYQQSIDVALEGPGHCVVAHRPGMVPVWLEAVEVHDGSVQPVVDVIVLHPVVTVNSVGVHVNDVAVSILQPHVEVGVTCTIESLVEPDVGRDLEGTVQGLVESDPL